VNVSCISAEKPTSLPTQLTSPTIAKFPSLVILPRWVALPVPGRRRRARAGERYRALISKSEGQIL
jgi:hypothetical protein